MTRLLKGFALFVLVACIVWVAVLWRWQATARDMTVQDIVVYLGLLPVALFVLALLVGWAWRGFGERETRRAADAAAAPAAPPAALAAGSDEAERRATVQLLAAAIATAAGQSAAELLSSARAGTPRPGLDTELRDDDGLPLLTARIADLAWQEVEADAAVHLAELRAAGNPAHAGPDIGQHVWRALAALRLPLATAIESLIPWQAMLAVPAERGAGEAAAAAASAAAARSVRVLLGWPLGWSELEQQLGRAVAADWVAQGATALPGVRFAISAQAVGGEELLLQADRLMQTLARAGHDEPLIVAACFSSIGADAASALDAAGQLYHPQRRPKGRMPAEAAAALVLAGPGWPVAEGEDALLPHLHRPTLARRDKSIDAPGRVGPQTAIEAATAALTASGLGADAVTALVGDADQHTERAAELYLAAAEALPHLDTAEDLDTIGQVTGAIDGVGALVVIACAAEVARANGAPCLALALGDPFARLAMIALPAAPVVPAPPAAATA